MKRETRSDGGDRKRKGNGSHPNCVHLNHALVRQVVHLGQDARAEVLFVFCVVCPVVGNMAWGAGHETEQAHDGRSQNGNLTAALPVHGMDTKETGTHPRSVFHTSTRLSSGSATRPSAPTNDAARALQSTNASGSTGQHHRTQDGRHTGGRCRFREERAEGRVQHDAGQEQGEKEEAAGRLEGSA